MKILTTLILLISFCFQSKADQGPSQYFFEYNIYLENDSIVKGYSLEIQTFVWDDSLKSTHFLKSLLDQNEYKNQIPDSFSFYNEKIDFEYVRVGDTSKVKKHKSTLGKRDTIALDRIKRIEVLSQELHLPLPSIYSELSLSDSTWLSEKPVQSLFLYGEMCEFQVFVMEDDTVVNEAISTLIKIQNEVAKKRKGTNDYGNEYYKEQKALLDKYFEIFSILNEKKVVILEFCSC